MPKRKNNNPVKYIVVIVKDGRYNMFGPPTLRSAFLAKHIETTGGISDTVPDGTYHYYFSRRGFKIYSNLVPAE